MVGDSFKKLYQKLGLRVSSGVPNTSVFGSRDETLALVFDVIFQKPVRGFHQVSKREKHLNHKATGRVVLLFSSVWKLDETRSTSF